MPLPAASQAGSEFLYVWHENAGLRIESPEGEGVTSVPGGSDTPCQTVLVLGPTSGTVYQLFASAEGLLLYRAGSEMRGVKESLLQRTDAPLREPGKGDIRVVASDVERLRFFTTEANSMKFSGHSLLRMRLRAGGRTRTFLPYISDPRGSEQAFVKALRDFAPDVCEDPEGILSCEPRPARFDRERAKRLNVALEALMVFTFAVHAPWMFLEVPQRLFSVLALLSVPIVLALCLIYPDELSLYQSARLADGRARVSLMLLGSSFVPALRAMLDFNFLDYALLFALSLAFSCLPIGLLITRMREWKLKRSLLLAPVIALLIYSLGLTAYLNWLPDFASAPVEWMEVVDMYVSERSRSPDRYRQHRTDKVVGRRMNFSSDALANFAGLLDASQEVCKCRWRKRHRLTRRRSVRWCLYPLPGRGRSRAAGD